MADDVVIRIEGLWKRYGVPWPTVMERIRSSRRNGGEPCRSQDKGRWALRDVNLEVRRGETLGIVGRNGAGKSTLLKVLAGVSPPTKGRVELLGSVFPMIELNAGLHMELTGRENVRLLGAVMGLSRREIESKVPEIEDFTDLGEWFDRPARTYSSGMLARLGFGVAVNIQSDVVLIDETFSVGDLKFRNKSLRCIKDIQERGATVLVVSHDLETIQYVARRGILMNEGRLVDLGSALEAVNAYEKFVFRPDSEDREHRVRSRISSEEVTIFSARLYDEHAETLDRIGTGIPFGVEVDLILHRRLEIPMFSVGLHNTEGVLCKWNVSLEDGLEKPGQPGRFLVRAWYPENRLAPGSYEVHFAVRDGASFQTLERIAGLLTFPVVGEPGSRGIVAGHCKWEFMSHNGTNHGPQSFG